MPRPDLAGLSVERRDDLLRQYRLSDARFRADLEAYSASLVRIATKSTSGGVAPFVWNDVQRSLHAKLEEILDRRRMVRALVLKARQLGVSTYVATRFYHRATLWPGRNCYILTHEDSATQNLFGMARRMHDYMPRDYRSQTSKANANELRFAGLESGYRVGTAKNITGTGRSMTIHLFHGSEVAFWPHAEGHFSASVQAVPPTEGTEIILESTANGLGGVFYEEWVKAERGESDYTPIFFPWFAEPHYRRDPATSPAYELSPEEIRYQETYALDDAQACWLHWKNVELRAQPGKIAPLFRQEYPATAAEAFIAYDSEALIDSQYVAAARRHDCGDQSHMPRVLGVDVARGGGDLTRFIDRRGRRAGSINKTLDVADLSIVADELMGTLRRHGDIRRAFIDVTGLGSGVYDICRANGFGPRVAAVNFGSEPADKTRYVNKRAEMWGRMAEWFADPGGVSIPDDDIMHKHIVSAGYRYDAHSRMQLEAKESIKKRLGFSPDAGDALALTFAENIPVEERQPSKLQQELGQMYWGQVGGAADWQIV